MEHVIRARPEAKPQGTWCGTSDGGCWARLLLSVTALLPQEKQLRMTYLCAEDSEREKSPSFSAAVRESHEKERTRAEDQELVAHRVQSWGL